MTCKIKNEKKIGVDDCVGSGNLLKREDIGAQSGAVTFVAFDGFGDIRDRDTTGQLNGAKVVVVVYGDQSGGLGLAVLELEIGVEVVAQPNGVDGSLSCSCTLCLHHLLLPR